jgi:hypothetical protein
MALKKAPSLLALTNAATPAVGLRGSTKRRYTATHKANRLCHKQYIAGPGGGVVKNSDLSSNRYRSVAATARKHATTHHPAIRWCQRGECGTTTPDFRLGRTLCVSDAFTRYPSDTDARRRI